MIPENLQLPKHPQALHLEQEELMRGAVELSKGNEYNPQQAIDLLRKKNVSVNIYNEQQLYYANLLVDKLSGRSVDSFGKPLPTSLPNLKSLSDIPRLVQRATEEGSLVRVPSQFSVGGFNVTDYRSGLLGGKKPVNGYVFILNPEEYGRTYRVSNPVDQQILFLQKLGHEAGHALDDLEFGLGKTASDTWGSELRQKEFNSMFYAAVDKTNPSISAAKLSRDYGNFLSTAQQRGNLTAPVPTIGKASSFSELKVAVKKQGGITSPSGQFYSVSELEDVIDEIVKGELSLSYATKADGFRAKVDELLKQQRRYRSETGGGFLQGVKNAAENTADNVRVFTNCGIAMSPIPQAYAAGGGGCITVSPGRSDVSELGEGVSVKPDADGQVVEFHSPGAEPIVIHQGETGVLPTGEKVQVVAVKSDGTAVVKPLNEGTKPSASAAQAGELSEVITKPLENNPELLSTVGPFVKTAQDMLKRKPDVIFLPGDSAVRYEEAIRSIAIASGIDEVPPIIAFPTGNQWVSVEKEIGGQIVKVGQELPGPNMLAYKDLSDFTFAGSRIGINGVFNTADSVMQRRLRITPNDERLLAIQDILKSSREDYNRRPSGFVSKFWEPTIEFRLALLELFYPEKMSALASARSVAFFDDVALTGRKLCCYEDLFDNNIDRSIERYVVIAENKARVPEGTHVGATQDVAVYPFLREYLEEETSISIRQVKLHNKAFDYESLFAGIASPEERNRLREAFFTSAAEFTEGQPVYPSKFRANEYIEFLQRETATPNKLERVTDDLSGAVRLPCNPITSAIIPQVYAGSRDPCQITLFGPNGPAAKASKAVKDLFAGEELPARTISPADENIAETIQLFFKTPLSDFPQSTVGRIGGGTTTATVVGAADNPTAVVLQLQSGLITVKPAVDQPLTVNQAKGIIAQLKNDNPNGFAVTLPTRRQGLIGGRTFGDILSSKGLVSDVNGRLTWIPDAKPREIKTPKGYTLAQTESDGIQYFSVKKDGQTAAVVAYDPNSRMILDVKSNSGAEAEAVQTVVNHLSGKQDFAGVEISGWLSRDQATAQTLAESGLVTTPAGRYTYLPEFIPKPNTAQRIGRVVVLTGAGILALVGLDQLANQPEAEPVIPLEIGKIPPEYADLEVKPVDEEVVESPLVEESPLPQVGPELEAYLRTEMAEFKEIQEAMQDASITGLIDRKLDEMDQLPDNEPIKDPETIALLGTMVGFEEISAKDWTVGEVRIVLEALKSVEPMDFLLNGVPKIYFVKVDGDQLPENRYGTSGDCNIFNQPDDKALNRCIKLYPLHLYSDIISQFRYDYQDADFTYSPAVAKIAHEIGHVLHYQREGDGFTLNPVFRRFNELFYDGRQVSVPNEEAGGGLQVLSYYPPAVLKEGAPTVYSATGGVYEDWADSVALFTNAHDAFCDQRPLRCGYLACVTSGTPSAQCDIVEKDENGKVRVIPNLEEAGMGIEQFESERLSQ